MARTKRETDELILAVRKWAEADPDAALVVAAVNDGTHETGALITLGHAGCTVASVMTTVAELLDFVEETILARRPADPNEHRYLKRIRAGRTALGFQIADAVQ